jgi:S1-C subfamily serine protease
MRSRGRSAVVAALSLLIALGWSRVTAQSPSVGDVFRRVAPAVVVIRARGREVARDGGEVTFTETGSGVLIAPDGKVMTAAHVVHAMDAITVETVGGERIPARVVASEPAADLSLIQLDHVPAGLPIARMANSDQVRVGDQVLVVGAPYGLSHSLSVGWISARWPPNTMYQAMPLAEFFQTDAVINTGNSGGPMFSLTGDVIGVVSHNISKSGGSEGLGFVVTMNTARQLLLERRSFWSGLEGQLLTENLADLFNIPSRVLGYLVTTVAKDSPAAAMGLRGGTRVATIDGRPLTIGGDIVLEVAGVPVNSAADLVKIRERLNALAPGAPFTASVLRGGRVLELAGHVPN